MSYDAAISSGLGLCSRLLTSAISNRVGSKSVCGHSRVHSWERSFSEARTPRSCSYSSGPTHSSGGQAPRPAAHTTWNPSGSTSEDSSVSGVAPVPEASVAITDFIARRDHDLVQAYRGLYDRRSAGPTLLGVASGSYVLFDLAGKSAGRTWTTRAIDGHSTPLPVEPPNAGHPDSDPTRRGFVARSEWKHCRH